MIDVMESLDPINGLALAMSVTPPSDIEEPLWKVIVDIGSLSRRGRTAHEYPLHLVGACDLSRRSALVRACGEAVERYALFPERVGPISLDANRTLHSNNPAVAESVRGELLVSGDATTVSCELIDYPVMDSERFAGGGSILADASPSGAASGPSREFAVLASIFEIVERDAVLLWWISDVHFDLVDLSNVGEGGTYGAAGLVSSLTRLGVEVRVAMIPTSLEGTRCAVACITDQRAGRNISAVGAKCSGDPQESIVSAIQESIQVWSLLKAVAVEYSPLDTESPVRDDVDRARFWISRYATDAIITRFSMDHSVRNFFEYSSEAHAVELYSLLSGLSADGCSPIAVDLSSRLPQYHVESGWSAVKVLVPEYQPLRMDESSSNSWNESRIDRYLANHGIRGSEAQITFLKNVPHPLV